MSVTSWLPASKKARVGIALLAFFTLLSLLGPLMVIDPMAFVAEPHQPPSLDHWLGTTGQGQDVLAQVVVGTRTSFLIGLGVGICVLLLAILIGMVSGYFGGRIDTVLSLLTNVLLVIPGLPLAIVIAAYLPASTWSVALVLVATGWPWGARVLRAQTMTYREEDFVKAARIAGESPLRILLWEILPNMGSLMTSLFIGSTLYAIGAQVGLEFLGLGNVGEVSWGSTLYWATNDAALLTQSWWIFVPTGLCIALVGGGLTLINYGIDEWANPRLRSRRAWLKALKRAGVPHDGLDTPVLKETS
jgi:peptide/nickel transport system permease protein